MLEMKKKTNKKNQTTILHGTVHVSREQITSNETQKYKKGLSISLPLSPERS